MRKSMKRLSLVTCCLLLVPCAVSWAQTTPQTGPALEKVSKESERWTGCVESQPGPTDETTAPAKGQKAAPPKDDEPEGDMGTIYNPVDLDEIETTTPRDNCPEGYRLRKGTLIRVPPED